MDQTILKKQLTPTVEELGYSLFDIEFAREGKADILRVVIDNDAGITIDDCVKVSEALGPLLDKLDPLPGEYRFEVASPGAERKLRDAADIRKAVGKYIYLETYEQKLEGDLKHFDGEIVTIKTKKNKDIDIQLIDINLIRLAIKF